MTPDGAQPRPYTIPKRTGGPFKPVVGLSGDRILCAPCVSPLRGSCDSFACYPALTCRAIRLALLRSWRSLFRIRKFSTCHVAFAPNTVILNIRTKRSAALRLRSLTTRNGHCQISRSSHQRIVGWGLSIHYSVILSIQSEAARSQIRSGSDPDRGADLSPLEV
jgi:hypothetical protein